MRKIEIDVNKETELRPATEFMVKHNLSTMVVPPELSTNATVARGLARGKYKIMVMVDWPRGNQYLANKFRGMPTDSLNVDGYEVLLTPGSLPSVKKEVKFLSDFFRNHFPPTIELRYVLGWYGIGRTEEHIDHMLEALTIIPSPQLVRSTHLTKLNASSGSVDAHSKILEKFKSKRKSSLKISGNININVMNSIPAAKFACTLEQARAIDKITSDKGLAKVSNMIDSPLSTD